MEERKNRDYESINRFNSSKTLLRNKRIEIEWFETSEQRIRFVISFLRI